MDASPGPPVLTALAEGVHAWVQPDGSWWINNAGAVCGPLGTLVIDTCATEERTVAFLAAVRAATGGAPLRLALNTHLHGDHTHGNCLLPEETVLLASPQTRDGMAADRIIEGCPPFWTPVPSWGAVRKRLPDVTFSDLLVVHDGARRIELRSPGYPAHTAGDVVAWLPSERVLFAGDLLFAGLTPLVFMGSLDGARRVLDWLDGFGAEHIVPGHGPLLDAASLPGVLDEHARYYELVAAAAREGLAAGCGPLEAARSTELGAFAGWADSERLVLNLHRAYADAAGRELDLVAAFADAVAYAGGPLRCAV